MIHARFLPVLYPYDLCLYFIPTIYACALSLRLMLVSSIPTFYASAKFIPTIYACALFLRFVPLIYGRFRGDWGDSRPTTTATLLLTVLHKQRHIPQTKNWKCCFLLKKSIRTFFRCFQHVRFEQLIPASAWETTKITNRD